MFGLVKNPVPLVMKGFVVEQAEEDNPGRHQLAQVYRKNDF